MPYVKAKLTKMATADGLCVMDPAKAYVGKIYFVDPETARVETMWNIDAERYHKKRVIEAYDEAAGEAMWFPLDLLTFDL